jgi:2-keto-3-deoxy-L-rhamnonate aldolase RhmA
MAMIEDAEALKNLHSIAGVTGLDAFFIGPGDLAMSMGMPGRADHPDVQADVRRAAASLASAGKAVATIVTDAESAAAANAAGIQLLCFAVGGTIARSMRELVAVAKAL